MLVRAWCPIRGSCAVAGCETSSGAKLCTTRQPGETPSRVRERTNVDIAAPHKLCGPGLGSTAAKFVGGGGGVSVHAPQAVGGEGWVVAFQLVGVDEVGLRGWGLEAAHIRGRGVDQRGSTGEGRRWRQHSCGSRAVQEHSRLAGSLEGVGNRSRQGGWVQPGCIQSLAALPLHPPPSTAAATR